MHAPHARHVLLLATALGALAGCAPATTGPMVMRLGQGAPDQRLLEAGVRTGPRLSAPIASTNPFDDDDFRGDADSFEPDQWGVVLDAAITWPLTERLHLHTGLQGEFFLPLPLPGYGVYAGTSYYFGSQTLGLAPAVTLRGSTDFGLDTRGGPGSMFGAEASCAFTVHPEANVSLGLVPFVSWHRVTSQGVDQSSLYYGGVLAAKFSFGWLDKVELSGGFGRAKVGDGVSWNVPILGVRAGR